MITLKDLLDNGFTISERKNVNKVARWSKEVVDSYLTPNGLVSSADTLLIECYLTFICLLKDDYTAARFTSGEQQSDYTRDDIRQLEGTIYQYKFLAITKISQLLDKTYDEVLSKSNDFIPTIY